MDIFENKKVMGLVTIAVMAAVIIFSIVDSRESIKEAEKIINTSTKEVVTHKYYKDTINIDVDDINVEFENSDNDYVLVRLMARDDAVYKVEESTGDLVIEFKKTKCEGTCLGEEKIIIRVPSEYPLKLNLNSEKGNVDINYIKLKESNIILKKGNLNIKKLFLDSDSLINIGEGNVIISELNNVNVVADITEGNNGVRGNNPNSNVKLNVIVENGNVIIN